MFVRCAAIPCWAQPQTSVLSAAIREANLRRLIRLIKSDWQAFIVFISKRAHDDRA